MRTPKTALAVFLKFPEPGRVKTRLARELGGKRAAEIYASMLERVFQRCLHPLARNEFDVVLFCDPFKPLEDYERYFSDHGFKCRLQKGDDLGARLENAFRVLFGQYSHAIAMGTDCIEMSAEHIKEARDKLLAGVDAADVVVGPAKDGGYFLIGLRSLRPELFHEIAWSTCAVFEATMARAKSLGLGVAHLATLSDIDTAKDLEPSYLLGGGGGTDKINIVIQI